MKQQKVEQAESAAEEAVDDVVAQQAPSVGDDLLDELDAAVAADEPTAEDTDTEKTEAVGPGRRRVSATAVKAGVGIVLAGGLAVGAVLVAGSLGAGSQQLPMTVNDPTEVISALEAGGIECTSVAVAGELASCTSTITVRVFPTERDADAWVKTALESANSAVGWAARGNVVVAAPIERTQGIAGMLGEGARTL